MTSSRTSMDRSANDGRVRPSTCGTEPADLWSAPEENPRPAPVSTTTRTSLSWCRSPITARSGTMTSKAMEFIRSGRFRVTNATPGSGRSTTTNSLCSATPSTLARGSVLLRRDGRLDVELLDLGDQFFELRGAQRTGLAEHLMALLERHQRRDRLDLGGLSQLRLGLGVDLGVHDVGMLVRGRAERRREGTTGTAPRRPEVDEDDVVVVDDRLEFSCGDVLCSPVLPNVSAGLQIPSMSPGLTDTGQRVDPDPVHLHGLRELRGRIRIAGPRIAHRGVQDQ